MSIELDNFKLYFPCVAEKAVGYRPSYEGSIIVDLNDGGSVLYDDLAHTIRVVPRDSNKLSEKECATEFARRLRRLMNLNDITQGELSVRTGVSVAMLSRYMNGKSIPSFWAVDRIAKALGCSADEFRYID